jgi:hypothetical protein
MCDSNLASPYTFASLTPPSSNPREIYRELTAAVARRDRHNAKIVQTKALYAAMSIDWVKKGEMSESDRDELLYFVESADFSLWRPLLYVVPRLPVADRMILVPPLNRASHGPEYVISDLRRREFDIIEL